VRMSEDEAWALLEELDDVTGADRYGQGYNDGYDDGYEAGRDFE
jgi:flagellar biosynthesis/type III secretory pathway protein FliH